MTVNEHQAAAFLRTRFGGDANKPIPITQGEWSKAYCFERATQEYVVRFGALKDDFEKDAVAARFGSTDLPIPPIIELGEAFGGFYAISERMPGAYLDEVSGRDMRALLPSVFAALDAMRLTDLSATRGYGIWTADGTAPFATWRDYLVDVARDRPTDRVHGWRERLASSATGMAPFEEALVPFEALVDQMPEARHLIHSDLLHFNVLVSGRRITAVIDWGDAKYGDFLYDVAWFSFWSPWYQAWSGIDFKAEAFRHFASVGLSVSRFEERIRCCELHIGLSGQAYCAFAGHWDDLEWTAQRTLEVARGTA